MKTKKGAITALAVLFAVMAGFGALLYYGIPIPQPRQETQQLPETNQEQEIMPDDATIESEKNRLFSIQNIKQGLDLKGGVYIVYEADKKDPTPEEMESAESLIRKRLDRIGSMEATVSIQGGNRLRVEIPGTYDAEEAVNHVGQTALLTFVDESGNVLLTGTDVKDARMGFGKTSEFAPAQTFIILEFTKEGTTKFAQATADNLGKVIMIMLDDNILSAPVVQSVITNGEATITGVFESKEAEEIAALIRSGSLPFKLNVIELNQIGAQLGAEAFETSVLAGIVGFILVALFMLFVYRVSGLAADLSLVFFILTELIILSIFKVTLTLPGIAGIILTVGMAVDANIVIFERIKEELAVGKTAKVSVKTGFSKALPAIIDGNITTLIAAVLLFWLGTGPIKGFAQTLMLGIVISMFTAIVITKVILRAFIGLGLKKHSLFGAKEA